MMFLVAVLPLMITPILALVAGAPLSKYAMPTQPMSSYPSQIPDFTKLPTFKADLAAIGETLYLYSQTLDLYSQTLNTKTLDKLDALFAPDATFVPHATLVPHATFVYEQNEMLTGVEQIKAFISNTASPLITTAHHFYIDNVLNYNRTGPTMVSSHFEVTQTSKGGNIATYGGVVLDWLSPFTDPNTKVITWKFDERRMSGGLV